MFKQGIVGKAREPSRTSPAEVSCHINTLLFFHVVNNHTTITILCIDVLTPQSDVPEAIVSLVTTQTKLSMWA